MGTEPREADWVAVLPVRATGTATVVATLEAGWAMEGSRVVAATDMALLAVDA